MIQCFQKHFYIVRIAVNKTKDRIVGLNIILKKFLHTMRCKQDLALIVEDHQTLIQTGNKRLQHVEYTALGHVVVKSCLTNKIYFFEKQGVDLKKIASQEFVHFNSDTSL